MFSLDFLKTKIDNSQDFPILNFGESLRSPEMVKKYQEKLEEIKEEFVLPEIYIKNRFFRNEDSLLVSCDFPYDLVDAKHFILWINSNDLEYIKKAIELTKMKFSGLDYIFFQNSSQNQNVGLTHFHFLAKF